jgi:cytochrome c peroxidase
LVVVVPVAGLAAACSGTANVGLPEEAHAESVAASSAAVTTEDGLADAYAFFKSQFTGNLGFDKAFPIGYGYHPGLSTEKLATGGLTPKGQAKITFAGRDAQGNITTNGSITATLEQIPAGQDFDLWFVKNIAGSGRTVAPETGDTLRKVGSFTAGTTQFGGKSLSVVVSPQSNSDLDIFDLDMVVITRAGQSPTVSRLAVGSRTLFEKRFFRERAGQTLDPVPQGASLSNTVESNDPLVQRGAFLFFNETFGGNSRTCGTCHRQEHNLTLDPAFIATLPSNDPLFVSEFNPNLAGLENSTLLRTQALNQENLDGFDKPPVTRSVQHTFSLGTTIGMEEANLGFPMAPPDHRLGWSGDGAPGRGTLNEFSFGAIIQHFPQDLQRRPGTDFRIPTQEELDSLEAFQLFTGRQKLVDGRPLVLQDAPAEAGRNLFLKGLSGGKCTNCHLDMGSLDSGFGPLPNNFVLNTGVRNLTPNLPTDDGFLGPNPAQSFLLGDGSFNVQPVIEAADTSPNFHNNAKATIEDAVAFYTSDTFRSAPNGLDIELSQTDINNIGAFLRVLNAAENIRQIRKRVTFVLNNRASGNTEILTIAINDTQDALNDLSQKNLNPAAQQALSTIKLTLQTAQANADSARPPFMSNALVWLGLAKNDLFSANPNNEF